MKLLGEKYQIAVTARQSFGVDIDAACGQVLSSILRVFLSSHNGKKAICKIRPQDQTDETNDSASRRSSRNSTDCDSLIASLLLYSDFQNSAKTSTTEQLQHQTLPV